MNILWSSMLLLGIAYGALQGRMPEVTDGVIQASREAVVLAVSLVGVTGFWAGLMEIAKRAGVIDGLVKRMGPVMRFLFPEVPEDHPAMRAAGMCLDSARLRRRRGLRRWSGLRSWRKSGGK